MFKSNYNVIFFCIKWCSNSKQIKMIGRKIIIIEKKFTFCKTVVLHLFLSIGWPFSNRKLKGKIQNTIVSFPQQYRANIQAVFVRLNIQLGLCSLLGEILSFL